MAQLTSRLLSFRVQAVCRHHIQLWIELLTVLFHGKRFQALMPVAGIVPAFFATGCDQFIGQKEGPFRFDALEGGEFIPLVMQPAHVFDHGLVAIPEETLVAVRTSQIAADPLDGSGHQIAVFDRPGGIPHNGEAGTIGFFAGRLPGQQPL